MTARPPKREPMTAEEYVQAHGATFVEWLQDNTVECACEDKYGCDESKRHGETIDAETEITCRRCFVPIGLQSVSLRAQIPGPGRKAARVGVLRGNGSRRRVLPMAEGGH